MGIFHRRVALIASLAVGIRADMQSGVGANSAVVNAWAALKEARPDLNLPAQLIVLAIAYFESGFGTIPMKNGFTEADGTPTHNWGAHKGSGDAGCFYHGDADEVGDVCFARYSSAIAGAKSFFHTRAWGSEPYASKTLAAALAGDAWGVAKCMKDGGYYTGFDCNHHVLKPSGNSQEAIDCAIDAYADAIYNTVLKTIAPALGVSSSSVYMAKGGSDGISTTRILLATAFVGAVGFLFFTKAGASIATSILLQSRRLVAMV